MITKRSTYGVHVMSQSILVQNQRLGHLLVKSGHAAEKKKKKMKEEIRAKSQSRWVQFLPSGVLVMFQGTFRVTIV